jgi:hypothetical protein
LLCALSLSSVSLMFVAAAAQPRFGVFVMLANQCL